VKKIYPGMSSSLDTRRQIRMWICGVDSKNGSEKNIEYVSESNAARIHIAILWNCYQNSEKSEGYSNANLRIQKLVWLIC
jgi:hypothetical protein